MFKLNLENGWLVGLYLLIFNILYGLIFGFIFGLLKLSGTYSGISLIATIFTITSIYFSQYKEAMPKRLRFTSSLAFSLYFFVILMLIVLLTYSMPFLHAILAFAIGLVITALIGLVVYFTLGMINKSSAKAYHKGK